MIKIAWNDDKSAGDKVLSADWDSMVTDQETRALTSSGAGAPSATPTETLELYLDTTNNRLYIAIGTSSSDDWKEVLIGL